MLHLAGMKVNIDMRFVPKLAVQRPLASAKRGSMAARFDDNELGAPESHTILAHTTEVIQNADGVVRSHVVLQFGSERDERRRERRLARSVTADSVTHPPSLSRPSPFEYTRQVKNEGSVAQCVLCAEELVSSVLGIRAMPRHRRHDG